MSEKADFRGVACVLAVPDAQATAAWWETALGFERFLEPPGWVFLRRGAVVLHLGSCPEALPPRDLGDHSYFAHIRVDSVDRLYAELAGKAVDVLFAPKDQPWGLREMGMRTPDGHRIVFAQSN